MKTYSTLEKRDFLPLMLYGSNQPQTRYYMI